MKCCVCGLDEGRWVTIVPPHGPDVLLAVACSPCEFLVFMPPARSEFGQQLDEYSRRQWRAHRRKEPFTEEPPKSRAEIACEEFAIRCAEIEAASKARE